MAAKTIENNLRIWSQVDRPPAHALKTIGGGRLRGMTDISPQWRLQALTELFGPCGEGWKYEIVRVWTSEVKDEVAVFAMINLYWRLDPKGSEWSEPVAGIGGSMLAVNEKNGLRVNDECHKMAVTDALSVACKCLGLGAEIYAGRWDGSKYRDVPEDEPKPRHRNPSGYAEKIPEKVQEAMAVGEERSLQGSKLFEQWWSKTLDKKQRDYLTEHYPTWLSQRRVAAEGVDALGPAEGQVV